MKSPSAPASPGIQPRPANLLALGSAAVLTVYAAGFLRTHAAAQALAAGSDARRRPAPHASGTPAAQTAGAPAASLPRATDDSVHYAIVLKPGVAQVVPSSRNASTPAASGAPRPDAGSPSNAPAAVGEPAPGGGTPIAGQTKPQPSVAGPQAPTPAPDVAAAPAPAVPPPTATSPASPTAPAATPPATSAAAIAPAPRTVGWNDGTYTGWGTSRHGDIEATVVIEGGKITGAIISRCLTRYSCSWVAHLQQQVVARQSPEVDNVSGATQSANAFFYAVSEALAKAK